MNSNNPYKNANEFDSFAQSLERDLNINDNDTYDNGRRYNHGSDHNDIDNDNTDIIANTNVYNNVNELNQQRHQWHLKPLTTDDGNRVKIITQVCIFIIDVVQLHLLFYFRMKMALAL